MVKYKKQYRPSSEIPASQREADKKTPSNSAEGTQWPRGVAFPCGWRLEWTMERRRAVCLRACIFQAHYQRDRCDREEDGRARDRRPKPTGWEGRNCGSRIERQRWRRRRRRREEKREGGWGSLDEAGRDLILLALSLSLSAAQWNIQNGGQDKTNSDVTQLQC